MNEEKITLCLEDIKHDAIQHMENCMASVYESLLIGEGIILEEINEHYKTMLDIYYETYLRKD